MVTLFNNNPTVDSSQVNISGTVTVDAGPPVNLPQLTSTDFAGRLLRLFPRGWLSNAAQQPGGTAYAQFLSIGTPLAFILSNMQFIAYGLRIKFAYGSALDTISQDFFGNGLPRNPGETDSSFRQRILTMLLIPRVTRPAIYNAILKVLGVTPRLSEPWAPGDTATMDLSSYLDVDGGQNVAPSRISDAIPYTGMIDVPTPVSSVTGGYPIYGIDIGCALDVGTTALDLALLATNVVASTTFESSIQALIQSFKAMGITVWVRFLAGGSVNNVIYGFVQSAPNSPTLTQASEGVEYTLQSWLQTFGVWLEVLPWLASSYLSTRSVLFSISTSTAPTQAYTVAWTAAVFKGPLPIALRVPVKPGQASLICNLAIPPGTVPLIMPDWDTTPYVTGLTPSTVSIGVSSAGPGNLDILFQTGSVATVGTGETTLVVTDSALPPTYALYATPSWPTTMSIEKAVGSFTLSFGTAAPAGAVVYYSPVAN